MFTGLIQNLGEVKRHEIGAQQSTLTIRIPKFLRLFELGESIAVNGVCLTAVRAELDSFTAEVSPETLSRTNLESLRAGDFVNIEFPLTLSTPLGGHFVQGHIDGVGTIQSIDLLEKYRRVVVSYPRALASFFIEKGSVTIDGVSLTVNRLFDQPKEDCAFEVMIIPHTWEVTTFKNFKVGQRVNLEVDILAKYIQRSFQLQQKENKNENFEHSRTH